MQNTLICPQNIIGRVGGRKARFFYCLCMPPPLPLAAVLAAGKVKKPENAAKKRRKTVKKF